MTRVRSLRWPQPSGWHSFTTGQVLDGSWRAALPSGTAQVNPEQALTRFEDLVRNEKASRAGWFVVLAPEPMPPAIIAAGSLDIRPGRGIELLASEIERQPARPELLSRRLERVELAGDPGIVCHDMVAGDTGPEGMTLAERGIAVRHVERLGLDIIIDLTTDDLAGFEQIGTTAGQAAALVELVVEEVTA